jgi:acetylornithine deacetylase/succinyl-diaminopimelate desuccinylase-like protein
MPDFHFLLEPSSWEVNVAFKGRVWVKVTVEGKSAHGGTPEKGVNAILKMMELVKRLMAIKRYTHALMPRRHSQHRHHPRAERGLTSCRTPAQPRLTTGLSDPTPLTKPSNASVRSSRHLRARTRSSRYLSSVSLRAEIPVEADPNATPLRLLREVDHAT